MNKKGFIIFILAIIGILAFIYVVRHPNQPTNDDAQTTNNTINKVVNGKFFFKGRVVKGATYDPSGAAYDGRAEVPSCAAMFDELDETTCDTCYKLHVDNKEEKLRFYYEVTVKPVYIALQTVYFTTSFSCRPESIARASGGTTWETYTLTLDKFGATFNYVTTPTISTDN